MEKALRYPEQEEERVEMLMEEEQEELCPEMDRSKRKNSQTTRDVTLSTVVQACSDLQ